MIETVRGPIEPEELGVCMPHEHALINLWQGSVARWDIDGVLEDEEVQARELTYLREAGADSLVDLTVAGIGQNPSGLRRISEATGLHVVMGCGWYRQPYYGPEIDMTPTEELTDQLVNLIEHGFGDTGIRPGIIGEIGSHKHYVTAQEERIFRAVGDAATHTGLAVSTHSVASDVGLHHLRLLLEHGMRPDRVVIGHADSYLNRSYLAAILAAGAYVQFDNIGYALPMVAALEEDLIRTILEIVDSGNVDRVLLSQDICKRSHLKKYGGQGYDYLLATFRERLLTAGLEEAAWDTMTKSNPRHVLDVSK